jgi:hypothetical protein
MNLRFIMIALTLSASTFAADPSALLGPGDPDTLPPVLQRTTAFNLRINRPPLGDLVIPGATVLVSPTDVPAVAAIPSSLQPGDPSAAAQTPPQS